jgi:hypothetical protein
MTKQRHKTTARKWSHSVTENSDALDLEHGVFAQEDPKKIAASLKRSAEKSERRKSSPYRSAMSMLTFYLNRAGPNVSQTQRKRLESAKDELRSLFDKSSSKSDKPSKS